MKAYLIAFRTEEQWIDNLLPHATRRINIRRHLLEPLLEKVFARWCFSSARRRNVRPFADHRVAPCATQLCLQDSPPPVRTTGACVTVMSCADMPCNTTLRLNRSDAQTRNMLQKQHTGNCPAAAGSGPVSDQLSVQTGDLLSLRGLAPRVQPEKRVQRLRITPREADMTRLCFPLEDDCSMRLDAARSSCDHK